MIDLDRIFFSSNHTTHEILDEILCRNVHPNVDSHHDVLLSSWSVMPELEAQESVTNMSAPRLVNQRHKVLWTDKGIYDYQNLIRPHLSRLQATWLSGKTTRNCISMLLLSANDVLTSCARACNSVRYMSSRKERKSRPTPKHVRISARKLYNKWKFIRRLKNRQYLSSHELNKYQYCSWP